MIVKGLLRMEKRELGVSIGLVVLAVVLSCVAFFNWNSPGKPAIEYRMPKLEQNVVKLVDEDKIDVVEPPDEGGGSASVAYSDIVTVDLSEKKAQIMFQNPNDSLSDMVVSLEIGDKVLGMTGRIKSGYGVTEIDNLNVTGLFVGDYDGVFRVAHYNPDTGEKAIFDLTADVSITVSA